MYSRIGLSLSLLSLLPCLIGCNSLGSHLMCWTSPGVDNAAIFGIPYGQFGKPNSEERYAPDRPKGYMPVVYAGTIENASFLVKSTANYPAGPSRLQGLDCQRDWSTGERIGMGCYSLIDLPLSLVMDTALLPVDIVMATCASEEERAKEPEAQSQRYWAEVKKWQQQEKTKSRHKTASSREHSYSSPENLIRITINK